MYEKLYLTVGMNDKGAEKATQPLYDKIKLTRKIKKTKYIIIINENLQMTHLLRK